MEQLKQVEDFASTLGFLPAADHIQSLELYTTQQPELPIAVIENIKGSAGSLRVYLYVCHKHGVLDSAAANEALALFCEHTDDASQNPGKHPNIDRLFDVIETKQVMQFRIIERR